MRAFSAIPNIIVRLEALAFWGVCMTAACIACFVVIVVLWPDREISVAEMLDGEKTPGPEQE